MYDTHICCIPVPAGKSSLLNAICGEERVIVCDMNVRSCVYDTHVCCIPVSAGKEQSAERDLWRGACDCV